jgi:hypothetical protein
LFEGRSRAVFIYIAGDCTVLAEGVFFAESGLKVHTRESWLEVCSVHSQLSAGFVRDSPSITVQHCTVHLNRLYGGRTDNGNFPRDLYLQLKG